jgi:hypothetical protein
MSRPPSSIMSAAEQRLSDAAAKKAAKAALKEASLGLTASIKAKAKAEREHAKLLKALDAEAARLAKAHERASKAAAKYAPSAAAA